MICYELPENSMLLHSAGSALVDEETEAQATGFESDQLLEVKLHRAPDIGPVQGAGCL